MGCTLTLHSFEFRFGDILAGKLNVFVHCDKLRTIFDVDSFGSVIVKIRLFNSITRHNFNRSTSINQFNQISFVSIFHIQMYDLSIQQFVQFNRIFISQREFDLFTSDKIKQKIRPHRSNVERQLKMCSTWKLEWTHTNRMKFKNQKKRTQSTVEYCCWSGWLRVYYGLRGNVIICTRIIKIRVYTMHPRDFYFSKNILLKICPYVVLYLRRSIQHFNIIWNEREVVFVTFNKTKLLSFVVGLSWMVYEVVLCWI